MKYKRIYMIIVGLIICFLSVQFIIPHYMTRDGLSVIGYHGVVSDEDKERDYKNDRYTLSASQFERHMKYLYEHEYTTYSMDEIYAYYQGELEVDKKAVALTFDDGYKNFNDVVKPILEKYNFKGTCFVIGKHLDDNKEQFLKSKDIENDESVAYYSHSYDLHRKADGFDRKIIQDMSLEEINKDFKHNKVNDTYFAFPYGRSVENIEGVLKENNVRLAFSYNQFRHMTREDNQYYLPRYMIFDLIPDSYYQWIVE